MNATSKTLAQANRWRDSFNPLAGLTMPRAVSLMQQAQRGLMADLQWLYGSELGIEATDADLMTIIERTVAGVSDMDWQVVAADDDVPGFDRALADEQKSFLEGCYNACDNLSEAVEHLVMSRFRGFSHLQPWLRADWTIEHLEPLPQWNMLRDGTSSRWAWNPEAKQTDYRSMPPDRRLSPEDYILLENRRPVNRIALIKYIRSTIAEKDWDAYVEIYGIPGVFIIMPPNVPEGKEDEYAAKAVEAAEAASGALPNGSDVKTLAEVRGVQPFQMRLEWLQKQLVLAGTGGMLTMLAEPTGIGGGASGTQEGVWDTIVRRVARKVESALNRQFDRRALAAKFPGRPALAAFSLRTKQERDVGSAVQNIAALSAAGFQVSAEQVTAETGYEVSLKPAAPAAPAAFRAAFSKKGPAADAPSSANAILADIAATILDGSTPFEDALKEAQRKLENVDPSLLAGDLEDALEKAMFDAAAKATGRRQMENERSALANSGHPYTKCPACGKFMSPNGSCANCDFVEDDDRLIARGKRALQRATSGDPTDVPDAMYRKGVGAIDFVQGWNGKGKAMEHGAGLMKIQQKHGTEMAQIPVTIAKGRVTPLTVKGSNAIDKDGVAIINGSNIAILSRAKGDHWRLVTHYKSDTDAKKITEAAKNAASV